MKTIELKTPVEIDGKMVNSLTMRTPKVKDMKLAQKSFQAEEDRETALLANLCDIPVNAIDELDLRDYKALQEALQSFLE